MSKGLTLSVIRRRSELGQFPLSWVMPGIIAHSSGWLFFCSMRGTKLLKTLSGNNANNQRFPSYFLKSRCNDMSRWTKLSSELNLPTIKKKLQTCTNWKQSFKVVPSIFVSASSKALFFLVVGNFFFHLNWFRFSCLSEISFSKNRTKDSGGVFDKVSLSPHIPVTSAPSLTPLLH